MFLYVEKTSYASIYRDQLCFYMKRRSAMLLYVEKTSFASICRREEMLCFFM